MFTRRFRNERFLVVWERFWDRVLRIRIQLRVQKVFGNVVHFGGPTGVGAKRSKYTFKTVCSWRRFQHGVGTKVNEVRGTAIHVPVQGNKKGFATD